MLYLRLILLVVGTLAGIAAAVVLAWFIVPQGRLPVLAVLFVCLITAFGTGIIVAAVVGSVLTKALLVRDLWRNIGDRIAPREILDPDEDSD